MAQAHGPPADHGKEDEQRVCGLGATHAWGESSHSAASSWAYSSRAWGPHENATAGEVSTRPPRYKVKLGLGRISCKNNLRKRNALVNARCPLRLALNGLAEGSRALLQVAAARLLLRLQLAQHHASRGVGRRRPLLTPHLSSWCGRRPFSVHSGAREGGRAEDVRE
eukprot:scaffold84971_cov70-Phaeocystis_antarctica.AAC.6